MFPLLQNNNSKCVIWGTGWESFHFMEKFCSQDIVFSLISWIMKFMTLLWILVHEADAFLNMPQLIKVAHVVYVQMGFMDRFFS